MSNDAKECVVVMSISDCAFVSTWTDVHSVVPPVCVVVVVCVNVCCTVLLARTSVSVSCGHCHM